MTSPATPHHGWLAAPWQQPAAFANDQLARSRGICRTVLIVTGVLLIVTTLLPWNENHVWVQFSGTGAHHYVSLSSTFGLAVVPWGSLVPVAGIAVVLVARLMVPDRRAVGLTLLGVTAAATTCCILAINGIERQFLQGLNQARAWGACGPVTPCTALTLQNPLRAACGVGAFLAVAAAFVALIAAVVYTIALRGVKARTS